jgi:endonuclease/exonuclease/phosphatase family metal-dependent hydrolase
MKGNKLLLLALIALLNCNVGCAQAGGENRVVVAFYNCENFFDIVDNPAKNDDEFTPGGKYRYTQAIYEKKLHNIATVIQNMGGSEGPAILGVAEVENNTVLNDLVHQPELARRNYKYEWYDGPDPRGINVALIYNPKYFRVLRSEPLHVDLSGTGGKSITRDVLHVYGILDGDTVHVFVNHWPSRIGGEDQSGPKRAIAAHVNKDMIDALMKKNPGTRAIVMGDLNDNPTDNSVTNVLNAKAEPRDVPATGLYDPWADIYKGGEGTESYKKQWNLFDQIIISGAFLQNRKNKLHYELAAIYKPDFIVDTYKGYEGQPHRSFKGTYWINGYSDHFPVTVSFTK